MIFGAVEFPPIENVIEWPAFLFEDSTYFAFNKIALIYALGMIIPTAIFLLANRGSGLVPRGFRTVAEGIVEFVDSQCIQAAIGPDGQLHFFSSQLHRTPFFNSGKDVTTPPFSIFRARPRPSSRFPF